MPFVRGLNVFEHAISMYCDLHKSYPFFNYILKCIGSNNQPEKINLILLDY